MLTLKKRFGPIIYLNSGYTQTGITNYIDVLGPYSVEGFQTSGSWQGFDHTARCCRGTAAGLGNTLNNIISWSIVTATFQLFVCNTNSLTKLRIHIPCRCLEVLTYAQFDAVHNTAIGLALIPNGLHGLIECLQYLVTLQPNEDDQSQLAQEQDEHKDGILGSRETIIVCESKKEAKNLSWETTAYLIKVSKRLESNNTTRRSGNNIWGIIMGQIWPSWDPDLRTIEIIFIRTIFLYSEPYCCTVYLTLFFTTYGHCATCILSDGTAASQEGNDEDYTSQNKNTDDDCVRFVAIDNIFHISNTWEHNRSKYNKKNATYLEENENKTIKIDFDY